ncbi:HpaII family restriction endonuclease, partial [Klebsiella pneumoniae]
QANTKNLKEVTEQVATINPLNYDTTYNQQFYTHKVKNFLVAAALGMVPHTPWNGTYQANGGYLVVKADGDVVIPQRKQSPVIVGPAISFNKNEVIFIYGANGLCNVC